MVEECCPYALHLVTELAELTTEKLVDNDDDVDSDSLKKEEYSLVDDDFVLVKSGLVMEGVCFFEFLRVVCEQP